MASSASTEFFAQDIVPNSPGTAVASYYANAYVGQFSSGSSEPFDGSKMHSSTFHQIRPFITLACAVCVLRCTARHTVSHSSVIDFRLHVYDMTAPITPTVPNVPRSRGARNPYLIIDDHDTSMKVIKTIHAHPGGWTITDSHLSPDNQR